MAPSFTAERAVLAFLRDPTTAGISRRFLMNLKETCQRTDAEWEERQKMRQEEMQAEF